jgi:hypothetical protein
MIQNPSFFNIHTLLYRFGCLIASST